MDHRAVLAAFDEQIRRDPERGPGRTVEHDGDVVRVVSPGGGWCGVAWSGLDAGSAGAAIARQLARFAGMSWEWKHYSHDQPPDLPDRLAAAGLVAGPPEALLFAEIADLPPAPAPAGIRLLDVTDDAGVDALLAVHDQAFGVAFRGADVLRTHLLGGDAVLGVVAMAGDRPVSAGRVEFHAGTPFASLWGGGTVEGWRGRGIFRALVGHRAALAAARGHRWLQVDALPTSEPILTRLGFARLGTTTPYEPSHAG